MATNRYEGRCTACGGTVPPGAGVLTRSSYGSWQVSHERCPEEALEEAEAMRSAPIQLHRGSGNGWNDRCFGGWAKGAVTWEHWRDDQGEHEGPVVILATSKKYYSEDGFSFGVGEEAGYIYSAAARPATEEEAAPILRERAEAKRISDAYELLRGALREVPWPERVEPAASGSVEADFSSISSRSVGYREYAVIEPEEARPRRIIFAIYDGADGSSWEERNFGYCTRARAVPWSRELEDAARLVATKVQEQAKVAPIGPAELLDQADEQVVPSRERGLAR